MLYFGDAKLDYIAMVDLDGNNRKMIINEGLHHIYSLAVYENSVYWSDWNKMQIVKADKHTGADRTVLAELVHRPMGKLSRRRCDKILFHTQLPKHNVTQHIP